MEKENYAKVIASQLREVGWRGPIVIWDDKSVKIHQGQSGVIISYNVGADDYSFTPYKGTKKYPRIEGMYADQLPLVVDLLDEMKKKNPNKDGRPSSWGSRTGSVSVIPLIIIAAALIAIPALGLDVITNSNSTS